MNLLDNADRYGGGPVAVNLSQRGPIGVIEVDDGGPGVPIEDQESIFDRSVRGRAAHARADSDGTGLGLALVRSTPPPTTAAPPSVIAPAAAPVSASNSPGACREPPSAVVHPRRRAAGRLRRAHRGPAPRRAATSGSFPAPATGTSTAPVGRVREVLYFVRDDRLVPVVRRVDATPTADAQLQQLLAGPTPKERDEGFTTALPGAVAVALVRQTGARADVDVKEAGDEAAATWSSPSGGSSAR